MSTHDLTQSEFGWQQDDEGVYIIWAASQLARRTDSKLTLDFYLGGLYVVTFNRLLPYFRKPEAVAKFAAKEYGITFPIWWYWAGLLQALTSGEVPGMHKSTPEVHELLTDAARSAALQNRKINVIDVLIAIKNSKSEACRKFIESGIDVDRLLADSVDYRSAGG